MTKSKRKLLSRKYRLSYIKYNNNQLMGYKQFGNNDWFDDFYNNNKVYYYCTRYKSIPYGNLFRDSEMSCIERHHFGLGLNFQKHNIIHKKRTRHRIKQLTRKELEEYYGEC